MLLATAFAVFTAVLQEKSSMNLVDFATGVVDAHRCHFQFCHLLHGQAQDKFGKARNRKQT